MWRRMFHSKCHSGGSHGNQTRKTVYLNWLRKSSISYQTPKVKSKRIQFSQNRWRQYEFSAGEVCTKYEKITCVRQTEIIGLGQILLFYIQYIHFCSFTSSENILVMDTRLSVHKIFVERNNLMSPLVLILNSYSDVSFTMFAFFFLYLFIFVFF